MADPGTPPEADDATAAFAAREQELGEFSRGWVSRTLEVTYPPTEDGKEDFLDDAAILEPHKYQPVAAWGRDELAVGADKIASIWSVWSGREVEVTFGATDKPDAEPAPGATMSVRYAGKYDKAMAAFENDAAEWAQLNWYPTSETYVAGTWGCGAWVLAFLAMVIVVGIIALAYMIATKPAGELIVIYEYRPGAGLTAHGRPRRRRRAASSPPR